MMKQTTFIVKKTISLSQIISNYKVNIIWLCICILEYSCWYNFDKIISDSKYCMDNIKCYELVDKLKDNLNFSHIFIIGGFVANIIFCIFDTLFPKYINDYIVFLCSSFTFVEIVPRTLSEFMIIVYIFTCNYSLLFHFKFDEIVIHSHSHSHKFKGNIAKLIYSFYFTKILFLSTLVFLLVLFLISPIIMKKIKSIVDDIKFEYIEEQIEIDKIV